MMDAKNEYPVYNNYYKGSSKINIDNHFMHYKETIRTSEFHKHFEGDSDTFKIGVIGDDVDEEKYQLLEEYCSVDNLTVDGELKRMNKVAYEWSKDPFDQSILDNSLLKTLSDTKKRNCLKKHQMFLKYRGERPIIYESKELSEDKAVLTPEEDLLVIVRIYVPFTSRNKQSVGALGKLSLSSVIAMPGFQTLDKLKDMISCLCDHAISNEVSEAPYKNKLVNAKDVYKSGFFFIEDTFYNDLRDPNNKDNSKIVRQWLAMRNFGNFKTERMETTRIDSLVLKFGYPWVYQHQGDCEHLISFSDVRLVNGTDELLTDCYPRIVRIKPQPNRYCMTCGIYSVTWVITNNNRLPHDPCLFCDSCFKSYNYIKGKKVGSFKAYLYPYDCNLFQSQSNYVKKAKKINSKSTNKEPVNVENTQSQESLKDKTTSMDTS